MTDVLQDVRYGLRILWKKPAFTVVAVLTLALGVGANTAIFSIVNAVLLRSLPYHEPERLVRVLFNNPGVGLRDVPFSVPELDDLRTRAGIFEQVSAVWGVSANLTGGKQPERLELMVVSPNYFSMLGARPQLGRLFDPGDYALGFAPAAVISDALWRRSYGADPNVLGRTLRLDNDPYVIVGVLPPVFRHPGPTVSGDVEIWATAGFSTDPFPKPARNVRLMPGAIARLKSGITMQQAQSRLAAMASLIRRDFPTDYPSHAQWTVEVQSLQESLVGKVRPLLLVLLGAVILIVFIVSLNIANLLLARAFGRQQEMAVRLALGASRSRMLRQMLTESILLSLVGGVAGLVTAVITLHSIVTLVPSNIPRLSEVSIDWRVLAFAFLISFLSGVFFGLAPAIHASRSDLSLGVREGARGSGYSTKTSRIRDALIVSEMAFAVVLMVGAGLLLRTLRELLRENLGFNPVRVVTANIWLPVPNDPRLDPYRNIAQQIPFDRELLRRMDALPAVELAGVTSDLPTISQTFSTALAIEDRPIESSEDLRAELIRISPDYFEAIQAPMVRGRSFTQGDENGKELVAIIDETTARRYWRDRDALGRRIRFGQAPNLPWTTIVGIVKDIKVDGLDVTGIPHVYLPMYQVPGRVLSIVLRTSQPATILEPQIRREVQRIDAGLPVFNVASMNQVLDRSLASRRFAAELVGTFAGLALLLTSVGIYGLLAYMVGQRSREIGLRMALGAGRGNIAKLVLSKGLVLGLIGIGTGALFSISASSLLATLLYGVQPHDPAIFVSVPVLLLLVILLASYIPAWRATKVDPMVALREA